MQGLPQVGCVVHMLFYFEDWEELNYSSFCIILPLFYVLCVSRLLVLKPLQVEL